MRPLTRAFAAAYLPLIAGLGLMARPAGGPSQTAPVAPAPPGTVVTASIR